MARRRGLVIGCASACGLMLAGVSVGVASEATKIMYVAPVNRHGVPLPGWRVTSRVRGTCDAGSDSVPGPVYRCFAGNSVLDPCWADRVEEGTVLCPVEPWSGELVKLTTTAGLPPSTQRVPASLGFPWAVQLSSGKRCVAVQGAHEEYDGRVVGYTCVHGLRHGLSLLRGMDRAHEPWTFDSASWTGQEYVPGPTETVMIAWYGGPAPNSDRATP